MQLVDEIPGWFKDLCQSCWAQQPRDRPSFDTIAEILHDEFEQLLATSHT